MRIDQCKFCITVLEPRRRVYPGQLQPSHALVYLARCGLFFRGCAASPCAIPILHHAILASNAAALRRSVVTSTQPLPLSIGCTSRPDACARAPRKERTMKICVLGAGVIGLTTAWWLAEAGHDVVIVDRNDSTGADASAANGGQLSYAFVAPLASPATLLKLPSLLMSKDGPMRIRPTVDPALL